LNDFEKLREFIKEQKESVRDRLELVYLKDILATEFCNGSRKAYTTILDKMSEIENESNRIENNSPTFLFVLDKTDQSGEVNKIMEEFKKDESCEICEETKGAYVIRGDENSFGLCYKHLVAQYGAENISQVARL